MSNSNREKSHSEGSDRHLHEPVQTVLHSVQRQGLGNVASNTPRSHELLAHPQKVPHGGGDSGILLWMESTVIQASNQKDQGVPLQKEGGKQGRSPSSFYQRGGNSEILKLMYSTITQASNQEDKGIPCHKERGNKRRSPSSFYQQASSQPTSPKREEEQEKNWRNPYSPSYRIPKIQNDAMDNVFNMARTLMEFKYKEEQRLRQPHFPKR
ncbi:hypothetical protein O181_066453 [Austropuccinia psidii MF-1]|uniref:Uncharacterized protein n=1 Tax=Austropuccinia psidii MF-1 TaxID=1389203 RepID=A0A9Q3EX57_9BASI|nr:hypothetical protein [Austropuccinia psidii MF-1]